GVMMIPIPSAGVLRRVTGLEAARAVPDIEDAQITATIGYPVVPLPEGASYLGFLFARGQTPAEVESALRKAHGELGFDIVPELERYVSNGSSPAACACSTRALTCSCRQSMRGSGWSQW